MPSSLFKSYPSKVTKLFIINSRLSDADTCHRSSEGVEISVDRGSTKNLKRRIRIKCGMGETALCRWEGSGVPCVTHSSLMLLIGYHGDSCLKQNIYHICTNCPWHNACRENRSWGLGWSLLDLVLYFVFNSIFYMEAYKVLYFHLLPNSVPLEDANCYWHFVVYPANSLSIHLYMQITIHINIYTNIHTNAQPK